MIKVIIKFTQILKILIMGKIFTKDRLTTLIGLIIALICTILDQYFGVEIKIPQEISVIWVGAIVSIIFMIWKPKETKNKK